MRRRIAFVLGTLALLTNVQAQQVTLILEPTTTVTVRPGSGAPDSKQGTSDAVAKVDGNEDWTSCEHYGRASAANGRASVTAPSLTSTTTLSYRLDAAVMANGGHYRTGTCIAGHRIGFSGHDTEAFADAKATALVRVHFEGGRPNVPYFVKISRSQSGDIQHDELTGPDGKVVPLTSADSPYPVIISQPGQDYFLTTTVSASARNAGGCCSDQRESTSDMRVSIEPAPLLFGGHQIGYMIQGIQTNGYKNVAVVLLEGLPHCTATLVASNTLVTAAHCVEGYITKDKLTAGKVTAAFGSVYSTPLFPPIEINDVAYPDSGKLIFNPATLRNDIAVLYLKTPVKYAGISPAALHTGTPSWQQIKQKKTALIFVGFGFNVINNGVGGIGTKREAPLWITGYDDYAVSFVASGKNPCGGDSGGPGFIDDGHNLLLAAINSGGDDACTFGFDTRIDAYLEWLQPRIKP